MLKKKHNKNEENTKRIIIVGGGSLGVTTALILKKLEKTGHFGEGVELDITIIEKQEDISLGASVDAFILHVTGAEYFKKGHLQTGIDCGQGGLAKFMMFSWTEMMSNIPIDFFLSKASVDEKDNGVSIEGFENNFGELQKAFKKNYEHIKKSWELNDEEARAILCYDPVSFGKILHDGNAGFPNINRVRGVVSQIHSHFGSFMSGVEYSIKKQALDELGVKVLTNTEVTKTEKQTGGGYKVYCKTSNQNNENKGLEALRSDQIVLTAGHAATHIIKNCFDKNIISQRPEGAFQLNTTAHIILSSYDSYREYMKKEKNIETTDTEIEKLRKSVEKINFTIQQENGGMYACVVPPTNTEPGLAGGYLPSQLREGSQIFMHQCGNNANKNNTNTDTSIKTSVVTSSGTTTPLEWQQLEKNWQYEAQKAKINTPQRIANIRNQLAKLYPDLKDYLELAEFRLIPRSVFNRKDSDGNAEGLDRRQRKTFPPIKVTKNGDVLAHFGTKWTTIENMAATVAYDVCLNLGLSKLPRNEEHGLGPYKIDMVKLCKKVNFHNIKPKDTHIERYYSHHLEYPKTLVGRTISYQKKLKRERAELKELQQKIIGKFSEVKQPVDTEKTYIPSERATNLRIKYLNRKKKIDEYNISTESRSKIKSHSKDINKKENIFSDIESTDTGSNQHSGDESFNSNENSFGSSGEFFVTTDGAQFTINTSDFLSPNSSSTSLTSELSPKSNNSMPNLRIPILQLSSKDEKFNTQKKDKVEKTLTNPSADMVKPIDKNK